MKRHYKPVKAAMIRKNDLFFNGIKDGKMRALVVESVKARIETSGDLWLPIVVITDTNGDVWESHADQRMYVSQSEGRLEFV